MVRVTPVYIVLITGILLTLTGCPREDQVRKIILPPTPAFVNRQKWGVITAPHLRLRQDPKVDAKLVTTFWNPAKIVLEILSQTTVKERIDDLEGYWYQVTYDGLTGWVFGGYLEIVESKEEALKRTRQLQ